jgi:molybdate transport system substrate-binding protein
LRAGISTSLLCNLSLLLSSSIEAQKATENNELLVAAAADLAGVEQPLRQAFTRATGVRVRFILGSSGMLARQIEQGAPYDAFLSANERFVGELAKAGRLEPDSVRTYAFGRLGLWSRNAEVKRLEQLREARFLHLAIANPAHAPYGAAARELLEKAGLWQALQPKVVYGENVREALQFAESGNADAAITAWSLVYDRGGILLPDTGHAPIRQTAGVVAGSPNAAAARRFLEFLASEEGRRILAAHGLGVPPK